ncbi:MAG: ABC transporter permease [Lachnospiraceae bacterium]|nr:ABC transporter permease [Lachnospiraceae bacterium]
MKKDNLRGWKDVFSFTLFQTLKSKTYIVTLIIMMVIAMVSMPLMNIFLLKGETEGPEKSVVEKVYLYNMTLYRNLDFESELTEAYQHVVFEDTVGDVAALETKIQEEERNSVILYLVEDEQNCYIQFMRSADGDVTNYELQMLGQYVQNAYTKAKIKLLGLTEEQMTFFETSVVASSSIVDTESAVVLEDTSITQMEYWFIYGMMFIVLMICVMASSQVASSIVQEKSSKVIEYLLTSIRPLAVIVGKVLAMLVVVMIQMIALVLAGFVSTKLGTLITGESSNAITQFMTPEMLESLNFGNIVLGLVVAGAGLVLYATLAGLCGATASRMEEANESLSLLTILSLVGFYIGFGAAGTLMATGDNAFVTFALIFPLSSSFLLPAALLVGKADFWIALIAIVVLALSIVLMFKFVAKVYEGLILHNGSRLKFKEVLAIAKNEKSKKAKKGENA